MTRQAVLSVMAITVLHLALAGVLLVGCVPPAAPRAPAAEHQPPLIRLKAKYDPGDVTWAEWSGDNRIEGSALLRTRGGEVRTCAALVTALVPVTPYAEERMRHLYGSGDAGFRHAGQGAIEFEPDHQSFRRPVRRVLCGPQGQFEFEAVPDGEWFVISSVLWEAPHLGMSLPMGGTLMQRISVSGGRTLKLILAH